MTENELLKRLERQLKGVDDYFDILVHTPELQPRKRAFVLAESRRYLLLWRPTTAPGTFLLRSKYECKDEWKVIMWFASTIRHRLLEVNEQEIIRAIDWTRQETDRLVREGQQLLIQQAEALEELRRLALPLILAGVEVPVQHHLDAFRVEAFLAGYPEHRQALEQQTEARKIMQLAVARMLLPQEQGTYEQRLEKSFSDAARMIAQRMRLPEQVLELCEGMMHRRMIRKGKR